MRKEKDGRVNDGVSIEDATAKEICKGENNIYVKDNDINGRENRDAIDWNDNAAVILRDKNTILDKTSTTATKSSNTTISLDLFFRYEKSCCAQKNRLRD